MSYLYNDFVISERLYVSFPFFLFQLGSLSQFLSCVFHTVIELQKESHLEQPECHIVWLWEVVEFQLSCWVAVYPWQLPSVELRLIESLKLRKYKHSQSHW